MDEAPALPAAPAGPRPFSRGLTALATLVVAAALVGGFWAKRKVVVDATGRDSLAAFDALIRREPLDQPLAEPVAADAERTLRAANAKAWPASESGRATRARLAVVLGERGRWSDVAPLLATGDLGAVFPRVVRCAYGPDPKDCQAAACDANRAAAMAVYAGAWCAARACVVATERAGDAAAAKRLATLPARFPRWSALRGGVEMALLAGGLIALAILLRRRHRSPAGARPDLPTPWTLGELYAALVRCLLWSILVLLPVVVGLDLLGRDAGAESVGAVLYLAGLWWIARIVFRRWGLSWRDSLGRPAGREIGLTTLAALGLLRGGQIGIGIAASALHRRSPWGDLPPPLDPAAPWRLALSLLEVVVLPPLVEELVFRRAILARLARTRSPAFAIVTSTILFTLPHGYSPLGLVTIFWSGLVFAWAFHRTGNLWPAVAAHAYGNGMALWWSLW